MLDQIGPQIYWANSMFSEADRDFNVRSVGILRKAGYCVFLPQEDKHNVPSIVSCPSSADIFRVDTAAILSSQLLVACIDQETIDAGVACEIGVAFSYGIPIIGFYTDIRQYRTGVGQMYKNLYVQGAIESVGQIASTIDGLLQIIPSYLDSDFSGASQPDTASDHFDSVAGKYKDIVSRLESWYSPTWNSCAAINQVFSQFPHDRILEYGCGPGNLGVHLARTYSSSSYAGYDASNKMIGVALDGPRNDRVLFTSSWTDIENKMKEQVFDVGLIVFALHDQERPDDVVSSVMNCLSDGGVLVIIDLDSSDLPRLTDLLRRNLARPRNIVDSRIDPSKVNRIAQASNSNILSCELAVPLVYFPSPADLYEYIDAFGILKGMDLPLGLKKSDLGKNSLLIQQILDQQTYPFVDQRSFMICVLQKQLRNSEAS